MAPASSEFAPHWHCKTRDFDVTVIDRDGPAEGASYGNAGVISPWSCVPQSLPGLWKSVPKWLLDPEGPLSVRWSYAPQMFSWLLKFLQAGAPQRLPAIADAMLAVNQPSVDLYRQYLAGSGEEALVENCLYLHVYRNANAANPDDLPWRLRRERGVPLEFLKNGEVQELEPEISPEFKSAVVVKQQGRTVNPGRLGKVLAALAEDRGARFLRARVDRIVPDANGGYRIETDQGSPRRENRRPRRRRLVATPAVGPGRSPAPGGGTWLPLDLHRSGIVTESLGHGCGS